MAKYEISKIDGKEYCVSNGSFVRHLKLHDMTLREYLEQYILMEKQICLFCSSPKSFDSRQKRFANTCGSSECTKLAISNAKQKRTPEQWADQRLKFQQTQHEKDQEQLQHEYARRTQSLNGTIQIKGEQIVAKRQRTCSDKHGDPKYNNSTQISDSLLSRSTQDIRKSNEARQKTLYAKYGKFTLNDFHTPEMFEMRRQKLVEAGLVTPLEMLDEWELFKREVRNTTERVFRKHKSILDPNNLRGQHYELDHIIPIFSGFIKGMSVEDLVDVRNLRIVETHHNRSRKKNLTDSEFERMFREVFGNE